LRAPPDLSRFVISNHSFQHETLSSEWYILVAGTVEADSLQLARALQSADAHHRRVRDDRLYPGRADDNHTIAGGHLVELDRPDEAAAAVLAFVH